MAKIFSEDSKIMGFLSGFFDMMLLGFLWLMFSVPLVTIGASSTAAYYTMVKGIRRKRGYIWGNFWKSFKMNFLPATALWLGSLFLDAFFIFDILFTFNNMEGTFAFALIVIYIMILVVLLLTELYLFPVLSRFKLSLKEIVKTSFFFAFKHLPISILSLLIAAACLVAIYASVLAYPLAMLFVGSVFSWLYSLGMESVLKKYTPAYDEENHSNDQWYAE